MAKIDTSKIPNYDSMTPEEKLAALEAYEIEVENTDVERLKTAISKANSEAAELKRKLKEKQTEEERKEAERLEAEAAIKAELETLRKEKALTENKARFLGLGYDEKLAADTAQALVEGNIEKVIANQKLYIENVKKAERAAAFAGEPQPPAGAAKGAVDKKTFDAMSTAEQMQFIKENPNWKEIITKE